MSSWAFLIGAIVFEVLGTSCIKLSCGFTRFFPSLGVVGFYAACFVLMSLAMKQLEMGIVYAVWCGLGLVLIFMIDVMFFNAHLSLVQWLAVALILGGVLLLQVAQP